MLTDAYNGLTKKADKRVLQAIYNVCAGRQQGNYTAGTWSVFQTALQTAKTILDKDAATQAEVDQALTGLITTRNALVKSTGQTVTVEPEKPVINTEKPGKVKLSSVKPVKGKKLTVKWKKDAKADGYEIQCSLKKDFKKIAAKTTVSKKKTSATLKKLKKGKTYYVRVCAYKNAKVNGKTTKVYGDWSTPKKSGKVK